MVYCELVFSIIKIKYALHCYNFIQDSQCNASCLLLASLLNDTVESVSGHVGNSGISTGLVCTLFRNFIIYRLWLGLDWDLTCNQWE